MGIVSNGQNIIKSVRCPITDKFYLMVNNSSKWHCYILAAAALGELTGFIFQKPG